MNVYLAGPFFNSEQIALLEKLEIILLNKGLNVFSPRKYKSEFPFGSYQWQYQNFVADVNAIQYGDIIFAVYNDQDPGTMWEVGYAWSLKKPIIIFNTKEKVLNLMIVQSLHAYLDSFDKVIQYDFNKLPRIPYLGAVT
ncbi:nucleoside 2-deoxyribosyltransferase [Neobacillus sp. BF23-41]|uniref:nucleoside 2-deoxyribosyltransferase n=1 Tax=Neobacillus sp. BF23-41 TaxID=3240280 RepID=UPI0034E3EC05